MKDSKYSSTHTKTPASTKLGILYLRKRAHVTHTNPLLILMGVEPWLLSLSVAVTTSGCRLEDELFPRRAVTRVGFCFYLFFAPFPFPRISLFTSGTRRIYIIDISQMSYIMDQNQA